MAGGSLEYMASYLGDVTQDNVTKFNLLDNKYVTKYKGTGDDNHKLDNYTVNSKIYGDAVWETSRANDDYGTYDYVSSWNGDFSIFPYTDYPFFGRGGNFWQNASAGLFNFNFRYTVWINSNYGFRVVAL
jgi:hypothetical protein